MSQIVKLRRSSVSGQKPTNSNLQLGELALNTTDGKVYMAKSGSLGPSVEELLTTNTINTGSVNISGSINLEGNQTITGSLIVTDGVGYINTGLISENSDLLLTSGSNIYVQDGGVISGSALQGDGLGIINIPLSGITNLTTISSSFDNRINQITGSVNSLNTFTSSVVLTSQTSSMTVLSASYAVTAAFALNAGAGGGGGAALGSYSSLEQTTAATTWSFEHNTGQRYPIFQVFDSNGDVIIPTQIRTIDENNAEIIFGSAQSGVAIASLGGGNGITEEFTNSALWVVDHNLGTDYPDVTIWDSNRNIILPDRIESVNTNQIKVYFSIPVSGHVSVSRGGHIISGSIDLEWNNILNKPAGLVSGSEQLTGSYDTRYVLSGSITQTTWDNIANKPAGIVSGSIQVELTGTTGYSTFSSSVSTSIGELSSSIAITDNNQNGRLDSIEGTTSSLNSYTSSTDLRLGSLETESGSIRSGFNSYTSSVNGRLDSLETTSASLLILSSSIESAFEFTGSNITIKGDLLVKGTETRVDSTTLDIGDNIISLNGTGATNAGLIVRDATAPNTVSGSLLWDSTNDKWIAGALGSEEKIILEGEFNTFTSSVNSTVGAINNTTSSLNSYTSSTDIRIGSLETESGSIRGDFNSYTSSNDSRVGALEIESGSIRTDFHSFTSSYTTSSFTGSFIGDGSGLYNIPASGVTGLELNKIVSGSVSASISPDNGLEINTDTTILGSLTSSDLNVTTFVSASNIHLTNTSSHIMLENNVAGREYHLSVGESGSFNIHENITSQVIAIFNTSSIGFNTNLLVSGSVHSSFIGDGSGLYNIPASGVTGLNLTQIADGTVTASISQVDGLVVNTDTTISGSVNITGSLYLNGVVVGTGKLDSTEFYTYTSSTDLRLDSIESETGSYATTGSNEFIGNENIDGNLSVTGSVVISGSLDISNANVGNSRYLHTQASTSATWSITHNLGYDYPNVTVYDGSNNKVMLPADVTSVDANTTQVTFATPEYGYALVSVGGISTSSADRYLHTQSSATGSWVIDHNIGYKYVTINVYDQNDEQLIPQKITAVSVNRTQIDFATPTSGNAIITVGGPRSTSIFTQTGSFYTTQYNIGITGSLVVSGDVDASSFNTTSDRTLKTNLERIEGALDKIDQLNGYTFDWISDYSDDKTRQIGMIANEVHEVQPELISKRNIMLGGKEEEIMLLDYSKVTALLIEGIKELKDRVSKLENKRKRK